MDKYLRRLEAVMIVVDEHGTNVQLTGTGDVLESACRVASNLCASAAAHLVVMRPRAAPSPRPPIFLQS